MGGSVLVTGAYGFVGSAVVHRLAEDGYEVVALTGRPPGTALPPLPAARTVHADVRDADALRRALRGVDAVCHLAALTRVRESFERPADYRAVNAGGTRALLAAADGPLRLVLASTAAVYGTPDRQPVAEDAPLRPDSPYGASKAEAEQAVRDAVADGRAGAVVLRTFNVSGAVAGRGDGDGSRVVPRALAVAAGRADRLEVPGEGAAVRDFVHVADVARACAAALAACRPGRAEVCNVGATAASVADVVAAVERVTGLPVPVRRLPPRREAPVLLADTVRIRRVLGWRPVRSGLDAMVADAWAAVHGPAPRDPGSPGPAFHASGGR
ncbi:NAD-dependent epimerase/dehydratase family protein [Streptacidiphilus sp. ASG 303]|uniref:NAD-dependent epimerase/dehydratase family protein n=1 Tax=Streptacidiphilus sp. ASG 303 TaxID=2896847 RepID=UPI0027E1A326|nr:NAD-dependent epimerase/dehydratase family protein [Streptacidiphilus sp. ASG 303]